MNNQRTVEDSLNKLATEYEQKRMDEASTTVTYIGFAESGVATSDPKWIIIKIESASGTEPMGEITFKYAGSFKAKDNVWDDRAILTYTT